MRKLFLVAFTCFMAFTQSCSKIEEGLKLPDENASALHLPKESEAYGKAVAQEIRGIVNNCNKMDIDLSTTGGSPESRTRFYQDIYKASPTVARTKVSINRLQTTPEVYFEKINNLTPIQIEFVERIVKACERSTSHEDLTEKLSTIVKKISEKVPEIQQERLFNVIAVMYYGLNEILRLEKQGHISTAGGFNTHMPRLKSFSENGDGGGGWGAACRKFLATGWVIAVGEPTPAGEIVMSVATVVVAGVLLYEVITCRTSGTSGNPNQSYCQLRYAGCKSSIPNGCHICLRYCLVQGTWPPYSSHKCT
ncbi:hypothetical protein [Sphingobacterium griseoflavum]|uniref:Lipoprotein n=1 Tax=Sphingobacterium griseoflavum TaxID=1474952 RepID=A0ABQ3HXX2_9SPHI|nr:hypothetical protein [Sphingobacterium griseoflavum]GHE36971.1 hypothetical protein GCM10017764_20230 [Sphingobacterium griseoflavum]